MSWKFCILSENTTGGQPYVHYRNLGAAEVARRLTARNIPNTTIEWFTHWHQPVLFQCVMNYLKHSEKPVVAISVPFIVEDVYHIRDLLIRLKQAIPALKIIIGGNRTHDKNLNTVIDHFFIGRSMEMFENWLDGNDMKRFATEDPQVYLNRFVNIDHELPVIGKYDDSDFLSENDIVGFEIGIGCRFNCTFCNYDLRNIKKTRLSDPADLANYMQTLHDRYGVSHFYVTDDTINESVEKLKVLADAVERLTFRPKLNGYFRLDLLEFPEQQLYWKKINMTGVFFGIESFNPDASKGVRKTGRMQSQLDTLKKLREITPDTFMSAGMIIGLTGDSEQHIINSLHHVIDNNLLDSMQYHHLKINLMGTNIFDDYMQSDLAKNPEEHGYKILRVVPREGRAVQEEAFWQNEWCNRDQAHQIHERLVKIIDAKKFSKADAYDYISYRAMGVIDNKEYVKQADNLVRNKAYSRVKAARKTYIQRKQEYLLNYTGE